MYALLLFIFILASLANWAMKSLFGFLSPVSRKVVTRECISSGLVFGLTSIPNYRR